MTSMRSALIVANDSFADPGLRRLRAPAQDAEALAEVLGAPEIGDFEVRTVLNRPAHEVDRSIEAFFADRSPDDLLLLHFSGHGVKDANGDLYFAAADTDLKLLGATAVSADFVNRLMSRTRSRRVVLLLDCCYAGAFERGLASRGDTDLHLGERLGGRGRAVITASTAMEYAFEGTEVTDVVAAEPSVFTSAVVEALRTGEADTDQDGLIGLDELYDYVFDKVRSVTPSQTPSKWTLGFQGELYLARRSTPVTKPAPLPEEVTDALDSPLPSIRVAAVAELDRFLHGSHGGRVLAARQALEALVSDDSRAVAAAAATALAEAPPLPVPPAVPLSRAAPEAERWSEAPPSENPAREDPAREDPPREDPAREDPAPPPVTEPEDRGPTRWSGRPLAAAAAVLVVLVAGGAWWVLGGNGASDEGGSSGSGAGAGGAPAAVVPDQDVVLPVGSGTPGDTRLVEVDTTTGDVTPVPGVATGARLPTLSPDRTHIVYLTGPQDRPVPRLVSADGSDDQPFLTGDSQCKASNRPAWSQDGTSVALVCLDPAPATLLLLHADRSLDKKLPTSGVPRGAPTWVSTGGSAGDPALVFMQGPESSGPVSLWALDPARPVASLTPVSSGPADTHPDGASDQLLFLRGDDPTVDLGIVVVKTAEGIGNGEQEVRGIGKVGSPTWSPDEESLAYLKGDELWVASSTGSGARRIDVPGVAFAPAWGSR